MIVELFTTTKTHTLQIFYIYSTKQINHSKNITGAPEEVSLKWREYLQNYGLQTCFFFFSFSIISRNIHLPTLLNEKENIKNLFHIPIQHNYKGQTQWITMKSEETTMRIGFFPVYLSQGTIIAHIQDMQQYRIKDT